MRAVFLCACIGELCNAVLSVTRSFGSSSYEILDMSGY